jgi:predicted nuclease of predicted toxin-antitoxin system
MTPKYLIDVNLPYRFSLWASSAYLHVRDLNDEWTDTQIWEYAKGLQLTIITKDADFSDRMLLSHPPPRVIHLKLGNLKMRELHTTLSKIWPDVCALSEQYKLVRIFSDRIGGVN